MVDLGSYLLVALGTVAGAVLTAVGYESVRASFEYLKDHGLSSEHEGRVNLSGRWYAAWQTTAKGKEVLNTELLKIAQRGNKVIIENLEVSPENKFGGYLWKGEASLYNNQYAIGRYLPVDPNIISKGSLFFKLNRVQNHLDGKWVGCNVDHELTWGFGVIAKEKHEALEKLRELCKVRRYPERK